MTGKSNIEHFWRTARRFAFAAFFGLACVPGLALAQSPGVKPAQHTAQGESQGKAVLEVVVVRADKTGQVDPSLKELQRQLSFTGFTGFKVVSSDSLRLGKGQEGAVAGGAGHKLKTTLVDHDGQYARARIQIIKGTESRIDTTVRLPKGKAFTVKGPKVEGGAMIYLITYE